MTWGKSGHNSWYGHTTKSLIYVLYGTGVTVWLLIPDLLELTVKKCECCSAVEHSSVLADGKGQIFFTIDGAAFKSSLALYCGRYKWQYCDLWKNLQVRNVSAPFIIPHCSGSNSILNSRSNGKQITSLFQ